MIKRDSSSLLLLRNPSTKKICTSCCTVGGLSDYRCFTCGDWAYLSGSAVDLGDGLVGIPTIGGLDVMPGITVAIVRTVNYNGVHWVRDVIGSQIVISESYVAETFASGSQIHSGMVMPNKITLDLTAVGCGCRSAGTALYPKSVDHTKVSNLSGSYEVSGVASHAYTDFFECQYHEAFEGLVDTPFEDYYTDEADCTGDYNVNYIDGWFATINLRYFFGGIYEGITAIGVDLRFTVRGVYNRVYFQHAGEIEGKIDECFGEVLEGLTNTQRDCSDGVGGDISSLRSSSMASISEVTIIRGGIE